jgi:hypothetical protein
MKCIRASQDDYSGFRIVLGYRHGFKIVFRLLDHGFQRSETKLPTYARIN